MRAANAFNFNRLRSRFLSRRPCSLAVALHAHSHACHGLAEAHVSVRMDTWTFNHCEIFKCAHLKFTVSGRSKPTNQQTNKQAKKINK